MPNCTMCHGDALEELGRLETDSVDSVVTDPPYGLSGKLDVAALLDGWRDRGDYDPDGGGFLSEKWDATVPGPAYWKEVVRVLKPGGHLLAFAGSRTVDLTMLALRLAGFEIRDTIHWTYAEGMPKGQNLGKRIDKAAGAEEDRRILGRNPNSREGSTKDDSLYRPGTVGKTAYVTEPTTRHARAHDGRVGDLKPAHEPVILARAPLAAVTSEQIHQATGWDHWHFKQKRRTGSKFRHYIDELGLQPKEEDGENFFVYESRRALHPGAETLKLVQHADGVHVLERESYEPFTKATQTANALVYGTAGLEIDRCRVGLFSGESPREVRIPEDETDGTDIAAEKSDVEEKHRGRYPSNAVFSHAPGCRKLGSESVKSNSHWPSTEVTGFGTRMGGESTYEGTGHRPGNETVESWRCVPGCPVRELNRRTGEESAGHQRFFVRFPPFRYCPKASPREKNTGVVGDNTHPTVKPVDLLRYLCRLVTPRGGLVLDPFAGSGSTGLACIREGLDFLGFDQEKEYVAIARQRIWREKKRAALDRLVNDGPASSVRPSDRKLYHDVPYRPERRLGGESEAAGRSPPPRDRSSPERRAAA